MPAAPTVEAQQPPSPPFTQCPAVGADTSCGILIVINPDGSATILSDPSQGPFDGADDTLVGVLNTGSTTVQNLPIASGAGSPAFSFDGDGLCSSQYSNHPSGCPFGPTGYEGPGTSFAILGANDGVVSFSGGLRPGASAYFSLESAFSPGSVKVPHYVALGDSYAAGEGARPFLPGTDTSQNRCHRATRAYPRVILGRGAILPGDSVPPDLDFWACSGGTIPDFYAPKAGNNDPPQLDHLSASTTLTTMSVGGNDAGFPRIAMTCPDVNPPVGFLNGKLEHGHQFNPGFQPNCREFLERPNGSNPSISDLLAGLTTGLRNEQGRSLPSLYRDVRSRAPSARVFVLGYPGILPLSPTGDCGKQIVQEDGNGVGIGPYHVDFKLTKADMEWMNKVLVRLNQAVQTDAEVAGFTYVDVQNAFAGHDICGDQPWANVLTVKNDQSGPSVFSFHPNVQGQAAMADLVAARITNASNANPPIQLSPQQTVTRVINVITNVLKFITQTRWRGSDVQMSLVSPSGKVYDRTTQAPGVTHELQPNGETFAIDNPEPGQWTVRLFGANVSPGEPVILDSSQIPTSVNAPLAQIHPSTDRGVLPRTIQFDGSSSRALGGSTIASYRWDFGDGSTPVGGQTVTHVFATPGTHAVSLTVTDSAGLQDTAHQDVFLTTTDQPPTASFVWGARDPSNLLDILFVSNSTDVDGQVMTYSWDFGDGTSGTGIAPTHVYGQPGKYPATLTVTDDGGLRASACQLVTAGAPPPPAPEPCGAPPKLPRSGGMPG
jgi:hypothetical protein